MHSVVYCPLIAGGKECSQFSAKLIKLLNMDFSAFTPWICFVVTLTTRLLIPRVLNMYWYWPLVGLIFIHWENSCGQSFCWFSLFYRNLKLLIWIRFVSFLMSDVIDSCLSNWLEHAWLYIRWNWFLAMNWVPKSACFFCHIRLQWINYFLVDIYLFSNGNQHYKFIQKKQFINRRN